MPNILMELGTNLMSVQRKSVEIAEWCQKKLNPAASLGRALYRRVEMNLTNSEIYLKTMLYFIGFDRVCTKDCEGIIRGTPIFE